jgi:DNA-binding transcriptional LysR family regulator
MTNLDQLRTFLSAYRLGSLSKAADALGITQPAASGHIKALEAALEKPLFVRAARGVEPTAAAHALANEIAAPLDAISAALETVKARSPHLSGAVDITGPPEFLTEALAPKLAALTELGLTLRLHPGDRARIYQLLRDGVAELAITASTPNDRSLGYAEVARERFVLVAAPSFARKIAGRTMNAALLSALPAIAYDQDLPLIREFARHVFRKEVSPQRIATAPDLRLARAFVQAGIGWSVLPDYLCTDGLAAGTLTLLLPEDAGPENPLHLVWTKGALRHPRIAAARRALLEL